MVENKKVRTLTGKVVSDKMNKTVTVLIERRVTHPLYAKIVKRSTKLHAHDENNDCRTGDTVTIKATRPFSKSKAFELVSIDERASQI
ncbi:MAG: 30S ribosomal protein S17 [Candidatus Endonucleobacter bathymodioli]|uniref:Small ribosomal subunit protein uS17 n=1 Tax=Candidatus Endonucleibacter bathymodioli TaxID=539814 RepID=A0AA90NU07_9GAMM|nr:30S ribosomal protein S17 [Candidatus Endonucleobacter bathymodioli]